MEPNPYESPRGAKPALATDDGQGRLTAFGRVIVAAWVVSVILVAVTLLMLPWVL
jgi:hypothetical protein